MTFMFRWPSESFCGPRVSGCRARGFTNPVTGAPNNLKIELESGFIWKVAHAAKTKVMRIFGGGSPSTTQGRTRFTRSWSSMSV